LENEIREEMNQVLSLAKRPYKIRNNVRADVLKSINKKFSNYFGVDDILVLRLKSEFDKRFFEYFINERYSSKIGFSREEQA
jgi:hypothetical protein